jgi:methylmalonyl-CoA mutase N-terminal domain/subunit
VNKFKDSKDIEPKLNVIDRQLEMKQINKLKEFKRSRDNIKVQHSISDLIASAEKQDINLMPFIISAVKNKVTLGEISNGLNEIFGSYSPKNSF